MKNNKNTILIAFICSLFVCTLMTQEVSGKMPEYTRNLQTNTIVRAELTPGELENCRAPGQLGATAAYHYSVDEKCKAVHIYLETWEEGRLIRTEEKQIPIVAGENSEGEITVSFGNDSSRLNQVRAVNWKLGMTEHSQLKHIEWKAGIPGDREFSGMRTDFRDQHMEKARFPLTDQEKMILARVDYHTEGTRVVVSDLANTEDCTGGEVRYLVKCSFRFN